LLLRSLPIVVIAGFAAAILAGCTDDAATTEAPEASLPEVSVSSTGDAVDVPPPDVSTPKPMRSAPVRNSAEPDAPLLLSASGFGPYRVGQSQQELFDAKMVRGLKTDEAGCVSGTGSKLLQNPKLRFAGGLLVQIELNTLGGPGTEAGLLVGAEVEEAQAKYPAGKILFGPAGGAWEVTDGGNTLLVKISGGNVSSLVGGVTASVEKRHQAAMGC
jgi:hypothetical protein